MILSTNTYAKSVPGCVLNVDGGVPGFTTSKPFKCITVVVIIPAILPEMRIKVCGSSIVKLADWRRRIKNRKMYMSETMTPLMIFLSVHVKIIF